MCLYPKLILNRKYTVTKKNKGIVPEITDPRVKYVPVGCGKCYECLKQRSNNWRVRMQEEIRGYKRNEMYFVTLTFNTESLIKLKKDLPETTGYQLDNDTCKLAVRRFLERWRKKHKKSVRHWFVTELGQENLEHIHIHGIIFTDKPQDIEEIWGYGWVYIDKRPVTERTINYIVKYITKTDPKHKYFTPRVLTSAGIGKNYLNRQDSKTNKYKPNETIETYTTRTGHKLALPIYYRNKIYSEAEREKLWLEKLDKEERYIWGEKVKIDQNNDQYFAVLEYYRQKNIRLGFGDDTKDWLRIKYENDLRKIKFEKRLSKEFN